MGLVSIEKVQEFQANGAVKLENVFDPHWVDLVRKGVDVNLESPSQYGENLKDNDTEGAYFDDYCNWQRIPQFQKFIFESPAAQIAARLMQSNDAVFYHEHVLVKEPGTLKLTPWHQDQPYYPVDGFQNCSIWMPLDEVDEATTLQFVQGSHLWNRWYRPRYFATETNYLPDKDHLDFKSDRVYPDVPVKDIEAGKWPIIKWAVKPGDCVVFHMLTMHGAPGNLSPTKHRRILSTRWLGDDAVLAQRPWKASPPILGGLNYGDRILAEQFPLIWSTKMNV